MNVCIKNIYKSADSFDWQHRMTWQVWKQVNGQCVLSQRLDMSGPCLRVCMCMHECACILWQMSRVPCHKCDLSVYVAMWLCMWRYNINHSNGSRPSDGSVSTRDRSLINAREKIFMYHCLGHPTHWDFGHLWWKMTVMTTVCGRSSESHRMKGSRTTNERWAAITFEQGQKFGAICDRPQPEMQAETLVDANKDLVHARPCVCACESACVLCCCLFMCVKWCAANQLDVLPFSDFWCQQGVAADKIPVQVSDVKEHQKKSLSVSLSTIKEKAPCQSITAKNKF